MRKAQTCDRYSAELLNDVSLDSFSRNSWWIVFLFPRHGGAINGRLIKSANLHFEKFNLGT
jgi:hypothetical protein